jgi:four helix bundle protein
MHNFRELNVYKKAVDFTENVYRITRIFPHDEVFGLNSQLRRASNSISLNIAEGAGSKSNKEFRQLISYAIRSGYECGACFDISLRLSYLNKPKYDALTTQINEIISMLIGLSKSLPTS